MISNQQIILLVYVHLFLLLFARADIEFRGYVSLYLDESKMQWVNLNSSAYNDRDWNLHASSLGEDLAGKGLTVYLLGFWDILPKGYMEIYNGGYVSVYKYKAISNSL